MSINDKNYTNKKQVSCSGREAPFDHPTIYLEIDKNLGYILCPYCSKEFILKSEK